MYNSPESWAIHLRYLRAVWWSQCQVPCLHLRDFRPDLGQKMVDAIVSCLPKNTESTITILGYRHLGLAAIPAAVFQNGGCLCSEITSTQKHRHDKKASYSRQGVPGEEFFLPCGGLYKPPRQKTCGWHVLVLCLCCAV